MRISLTHATAASLAAAILTAGCGGDADGTGGGPDSELTISAAASLSEAFDAYGELLPGEQRFSFAGSDELAAQIRQGARPDVFAAANTAYPEELAADGLVEEPVVFAQNRLVVAVPRDSTIDSVEALTEPGLDLVVCAAAVPCGDYTREVLGGLPEAEQAAIQANVRSEESDVKGVLGKVAQGAADAGFVYASDAAAASEDVRPIELPSRLGPEVSYMIAVVAGADNVEGARRFVDSLLESEGSAALADAGFMPPPP